MSPHLQGFSAHEWVSGQGVLWEESSGQMALSRGRIARFFPLLSTRPWALHAELTGPPHSQEALRDRLESEAPMIAVVDLGPEAHAALRAPVGWTEVLRHSRIMPLPAVPQALALPKTREKQERRFLKEGGTVMVDVDHDPATWGAVERLHHASRERKGLHMPTAQLSSLLHRIAKTPWTFASAALDEEGNAMASGGFVVLADGTCVYAFGGQQRGPMSGRASVAMICAAVRQAQSMGCHTFDFGGSQDLGVDRFYKEFGGQAVPRRRWVKAPLLFRWCFPKLWRTWTQTSHAVDH